MVEDKTSLTYNKCNASFHLLILTCCPFLSLSCKP